MILEASLRTGFPQWRAEYERRNTRDVCQEATALSLVFSWEKAFFQLSWWQQRDWKNKLLITRFPDFSGLSKKSAYARATEEASIFSSKFKQVQERLPKDVVWTSVYSSRMTPPSTYAYSPFLIPQTPTIRFQRKNIFKVLYKPLSTQPLDWLNGF